VVKAKEMLAVFARDSPSVGELLRNRRSRFDRLHAVLPSTATTAESLELTAQAWDQCERLTDSFTGAFRVETTDSEATVPDRVRFTARGGAVETVGGFRFGTPGTHYVTFTHEATGERYVSNPVEVHESPPDERHYWGDIHVHSRLSDGVGTPEEAYRFGRDVMALDVVACTDHDTMGFFIPPSWQRKRMHRRYVDRLKRAAVAFDEAGEFVTLFGYEWTKQPNRGGHVNVYFDGVREAPLFDSHDPETNTYEKLWKRLREWNERHDTDVLTIPHHPAEAMYPFDFSAVEYDDELAPLVEVYSQWGSSERPASDGNRYPLAMGQGEVGDPGYYAQDALELGNRVGFLAASDYHGPHPGHSLIHSRPHLPSLDDWRRGVGWSNIWRVWNERSYAGGLTAFRAPELTREAVFDSLASRRVYGTTQPDRILVDFRVDGVRVGEAHSRVLLDAPDAERTVRVEVAGTGPLAAVTVVKNNEPWRTWEGTADRTAGLDAYTATVTWTDDEPVRGLSWDDERGTADDVYYLRLRQADDGAAWAGPLWVGVDGEPGR
jgi:hypothetical protein